MQWRRGLTLRFAKPPFAGSTPACISKISEAFLKMQEHMACAICIGSRIGVAELYRGACDEKFCDRISRRILFVGRKKQKMLELYLSLIIARVMEW